MGEVVKITKASGIPLLGCIAFGIIDRGTNILQVRATSACNMKCSFCSTSANDFDLHPNNFIVEVNYLLEEVKKVAKLKGPNTIVFLDSVGEPTSYPDFAKLVAGLRKIPEISEIIVITNGTFLSKKLIEDLEQAKLTRINVSLHSLHPERSKKLFGMESYNVEKVLESLRLVAKSKIELLITPVWLPGVNDEDVEEVIKFAKEVHATLGIQKYEVYPLSRKLKVAKKLNYWKFYDQLRKWEKKYDVKLVVDKKDFHVEKRERIPEVFREGERTQVIIRAPGWIKHQMIGVAKGRSISVNKCSAEIGDKINIKILETSNNIYLAEENK